MKCLILAGEGAIQQVRIGYAQAMAHIGIQCLLWHPASGRPIFDVFDEFNPDIVLCGSWEIDRPLLKNLLQRPEVKLILWGGNWGSFDKEIDWKADPILRITDKEKETLPQIIKNNSVKHIFTYYHQKWANITHDKWRELGLEPVGVPLAANLVSLGLGTPLDILRCDVSFIGGYWPYKAINLNKYILPLCYPNSNFNTKIFGYGNWPVAQYLGVLEDNLLPSLFVSSTINVNVFEPLAAKYGFDVNERCYKIIACGGFCVSEYCESAAHDIFTNNEICFVDSPESMKSTINTFMLDPSKRQSYITNGIHSIKYEHNYFMRLRTIFEKLNISNPFLHKVIEELQHD